MSRHSVEERYKLPEPLNIVFHPDGRTVDYVDSITNDKRTSSALQMIRFYGCKAFVIHQVFGRVSDAAWDEITTMIAKRGLRDIKYTKEDPDLIAQMKAGITENYSPLPPAPWLPRPTNNGASSSRDPIPQTQDVIVLE